MSVQGVPLIVHVVYRFAVGGLENGVVNLVNRLPAQSWRHAVVSLTDVDASFASRIRRRDVEIVSLHKPPGHGLRLYPKLFSLFRRMRPALVHTRNLAALEAVVPAWAAGVPARVHGEHGWEAHDPRGERVRYRRVRRLYRPFVTHYVALSPELARYLRDGVGVPASRMDEITNGVDIERFAPSSASVPRARGPFSDSRLWLVGTVGRMDAVKDTVNLARAFVDALAEQPAARERLRLVFVGDGPLRAQAEDVLERAGVRDLAWFAGERADVPNIMRGLDCFALPSLAEGVSNTILEAMASGLPVVATDVGANGLLVANGRTGLLVPANESGALARAILRYYDDPALATAHARAARERAESEYSLDVMVDRYHRLYARLGHIGAAPAAIATANANARHPPA